MSYFTKFQQQKVQVHSEVVGDIDIACRTGGQGPAILLLHGYPQTSYIWRYVADTLAEKYTVVLADLRGYGQSSKPEGSNSHVEYSKREMASDMVQVMKHFGHERFNLIAHDRGARVAHRLVLDHPGTVQKLMLLDIAPTLHMYEQTDMAFAMGYWHWFFLPQPSPGPENMIMADPSAYWAALASRESHKNVIWSEEDIKEYQDAYFTKEAVHAACEDYRAAATIDLDHDRESREKSKLIETPDLRILWGKKGVINTYGDVVGIWGNVCSSSVRVTGQSVNSGHYIAEEVPEELLKEVLNFLA